MDGNRDTWRKAVLARDSILWWHFQSFKRRQLRMRRWSADPDFPAMVLLRSPTEVERRLAKLG